MIGAQQYLCFLMTADNMFYYEDNGNVFVSGNPVPLVHTPGGWLDIEIQRIRNTTYFALDVSFTLPLDFVKDGALILKYLAYKNGIEDQVYLSICERKLYWGAGGENLLDEQGNPILDQSGNPILDEEIGTYGFYYTLLYKGEVDLSQFDDQGAKVTLNIMQGGAAKLLKANEGTTYAIPIADPVLVKMDGVRLHQKADFLIWDGTPLGDERLGNHIIGLRLITIEGTSSVNAVEEDRKKTDLTPANLADAKSFFLTSGSRESTATITWDFVEVLQLIGIGDIPTSTVQLSLLVLRDKTLVATIALQAITAIGRLIIDQPLHFSGTWTGTIPEDCELIAYMSVSNEDDHVRFTYQEDNAFPGSTFHFTIDYLYTLKTTYIPAMRPRDLLSALAVKMGIKKIVSSVLDDYKHVVVTCGDAIRNITKQTITNSDGTTTDVPYTPTIKTSLSAFFKSFNTVLSIGIMCEGDTLRLERKSYFVDYDTPIALGESKNVRITPSKDYIFNTIKVGYPAQSYDDVNGRQEFNNTLNFTSPITKLQKELDLTSDYRGDCYGIEFTRINLDGKTTTDSDSDNDVFLLHIEQRKAIGHEVIFDYYNLDRSLNASATGLLEPSSVFNLWLSPKMCLLRNSAFIHSCFYRQDNLFLTFQSTDKNAEVAFVYQGRTIREKDNVEIGDLDAPLFFPWTIEMETAYPRNLLDLFASRRISSFSTIINGVTYVGMPQKDASRPVSRASETYQILSAPTNDLTKLIDYHGE